MQTSGFTKRMDKRLGAEEGGHSMGKLYLGGEARSDTEE